MRIKLVIILLFVLIGTASAQTTAFNYQGNLSELGMAANGNYLLQFEIYDAAVGGNQIGATSAFDGTNIWVSICSTNHVVRLPVFRQILHR